MSDRSILTSSYSAIRLIVIAICLNFSPTLLANTPQDEAASQRDSIPEISQVAAADSTMRANTLDELVVTGKSSYVIDDGIAYMPDRRSKKFSWSAESLLLNMAIPTVYVDRSNGKVTTTSGEPITMFIDYLPATSRECANLNPQDVKNVEVLYSPSDPRFMGNKNVVNFIMYRYEYGGYVRGDANQTFEYNKGDYSLYDKTSYKAMTYDIAGGFSYSRDMSGIMQSTDTYHFPDETVSVIGKGDPTIETSRSYYASVKALYRNNSCVVSNTLSVSGNPSPYNTTFEDLAYQPSIFPDQHSSLTMRRRSLSMSWENLEQINLNKDWMLLISPTLRYRSGDINRSYKSEISDYSYDITEKRWSASMRANLVRRISIGNIIIRATGAYQNDRIIYRGSADNNVNQRSGLLSIGANNYLRLGKFNVSYGLDIQYFDISDGSVRNRQVLPSASLHASFKASDSHMLTLQSQYDDWGYDPALTNPAMIRLGLMDAVYGNPDLKHTPVLNINLSHNWLSGKAVNTSAFIRAHYRHKPITAVYTPSLDDDGKPLMLRTYDNLGHHYFIEAGASATLRLLDGAFEANAKVSGQYYDSKGPSHITAWTVPAQIGVAYYLGNFGFHGGYQFPSTIVYPGSNEKTRQYYYLAGTYNLQNFRISVQLYNFCNNSWRGFTTEIINPVMSQIQTSWSSLPHRGISLTLSYIFRYGKRMKMQNELSEPDSGKSSVLIQ